MSLRSGHCSDSWLVQCGRSAMEQLCGHQLLICDTVLVSNFSYLLKVILKMKHLEN